MSADRTRDPAPGAAPSLTCVQVDDLLPLYVLDALDGDEARDVADHLATCSERHEVTDLATAAAGLALSVEPADAPAELRGRVLAAIEATPQEASAPTGGVDARETLRLPPAAVRPRPEPTPIRPSGRGSWALTGLAAAAIVLIVVMSSLALVGWQRAGDVESRLALLRRAVAMAADPDANVASLSGSDAAAGSAGYAVFPPGEAGFIVVEGLPAVPADSVYQAWYLAGGVPTSAGVLSIGGEGLAVLTGLEPVPGTDTIALTIEPAPGSPGPTSTPIVVGTLRAATAAVSRLRS